MEIVTCKDVTKVYGKGEAQVAALKGIDLSLLRGEFLAVAGASGSGKSTLLHILGSVDKATSGTVLVDGIDVCSLDPEKAAIFRRRTVGLIYQFYNLIPTLTVEQNILMPLLLDKQTPDRAYLKTLISFLGLLDKRNAMPHQLSGGQQQRVAIARALMARPALILADEPTGNLDRQNAAEIVSLLKQANRELGQTILLITHDPQVADAADRIVTMCDGRLISQQDRG